MFANSLLSSGQSQNIDLACHLLTFDAVPEEEDEDDDEEEDEENGVFDYKFSFERSQELVIDACQEYFNAAVSSSDEDMTLAM